MMRDWNSPGPPSMSFYPLIERERAIISPPPRLKISEWAEKYAYLPETGNAEPGKYHLKRMPWQAAMLDDPMDTGVSEIVWMMASQISGKTTCSTFITEYQIQQARKSVVFVRRTREDALEFMRDKLESAIDETPCMAGLLVEPRKRDSKSTTLSRKFPGGVLKLIGAKSPGKFRSFSAPNIFLDEIDSYEVIKEGDPVALAERGAKNFTDKTILKLSTPTLTGFSRIEAAFLTGDQQYYFVPCPCCGHMQHLQTERVKFTFTEDEHKNIESPNEHNFSIGDFKIRDTEKAIYVCEACQKGWTDSQRIAAIMSGHRDNAAVEIKFITKDTMGFDALETAVEHRAEWRPTTPFKGIRSRHLNGVYAVIGLDKRFKNYLHQFAEMFLKAKHEGRDSFMVWVNTVKTIPFEDEAEKVDWKDLKACAEEYGPSKETSHVPDNCMMVIGMLDNQQDRVEITTMGLGAEEEDWVLDYKVIYGDFDMPEMRERVGEYLVNKRFTHRHIGEMGYEMVVCDSAFQKSPKVKAVYRFCKEHAARQFFAIRGTPNMEGTIYSTRVENVFKIRIFNFNVDYLKSIASGRLKNRLKAGKFANHPHSIHFPARPEFDEKYFVGICSEKLQTKKLPNGGSQRVWVKITSSVRNEPWDLIVYGLGAREILRKAGKVEWIERKWANVKKKLELEEPTKPTTLLVPAEAKEPEMTRTVLPRPQSPFRKISVPSWQRRTWNPHKV